MSRRRQKKREGLRMIGLPNWFDLGIYGWDGILGNVEPKNIQKEKGGVIFLLSSFFIIPLLSSSFPLPLSIRYINTNINTNICISISNASSLYHNAMFTGMDVILSTYHFHKIPSMDDIIHILFVLL